jgi:hypothetical protein
METNGNHDNHQSPAPRQETILTVALTGLAAAFLLLGLILVTGGFFFFVALAAAAVTGLGFLHYLLWGHGMTHEVEEEQSRTAAAREISDRLRRTGNEPEE